MTNDDELPLAGLLVVVHGYRVDCTDCGTVAEERARCPLCDAPGPLRARPGG